MDAITASLGIIFVILVFIILPGIRIVNQYERGIVLRLGKYSRTLSPGMRVIIPYIDKMVKVDVRTTPMDIPKQEVITKDNVTVNVDAIVYFKVLNAEKAVLETTNYTYATSTFAQTALRDVTGNFDLDEILSKRDEISMKIREIVDAQTDKWGIDIENVKLQNIELPADMKRAMAKQAEAERERRAAIISAEGEKSAANAVAEAANLLARTPGGLNIRTLQTLEKISSDPSQKTVIMLPTDIINKLGR
ncbi:SPFH domain-containing protein [Candidatus Saccharibacteria bacterium]|nr:SPFH domain-containing protein [Candidatus Saccharibacteria bacterium]MBR1796370.1 SPFH domain-containing protein [Candidatus Saccharibacteria bacterium]